MSTDIEKDEVAKDDKQGKIDDKGEKDSAPLKEPVGTSKNNEEQSSGTIKEEKDKSEKDSAPLKEPVGISKNSEEQSSGTIKGKTEKDSSSLKEIKDVQSISDKILYSKELGRFVLQDIVVYSNSTRMVSRVYYNQLKGDSDIKYDGTIKMFAGDILGFNTYFNSFYMGYWGKCCDVLEVSLSGIIKGEAIIKLFRSQEGQNVLELGKYPIGFKNTETDFHINFNLYESLGKGFGTGRVFFDIEAKGNCSINTLAYCTLNPPVQKKIELTIGVCTYKKEDYTRRLLANYVRFMRRNPGIVKQLIVVNNDPESVEIEQYAKATAKRLSVSVVNQNNIGGAGGFTRSLRESLKLGNDGYHLFMDDDVYFDTAVLKKIYAILSYMRKDFIIGGQMFDMTKPHMLYEGGAKLDYWGFLQKVGESIDTTDPAQLCFYDKVRKIDYNAWWCAAIPKKAVNKIGLPMNIFIRGDDFEYGLRMKSIGIETVSFPGIFVWHEPFEGKTSSWLEYYNWRNRLIVCSVNEELLNISIQPVDMVRDIIVNLLGERNLAGVLALCLGFLDFLGGPEKILGNDASEINDTLRKQLKWIEEDSYSDILSSLLESKINEIDKGEMEYTKGAIILEHSLKLGGIKRDKKKIWWLGTDINRVINDFLACYMAHANKAKMDWRTSYFKYTTEDAWRSVYGK